MRVPPEEFEELVGRALDGLPDDFAALLDNVAVVVAEEATDEDLLELGLDPQRDELLGQYQGIPIGERGSAYSSLPDRVVIYRGPILRCSSSRRQVIHEIRDTVVHELGHHFGLAEEEMPY